MNFIEKLSQFKELNPTEQAQMHEEFRTYITYPARSREVFNVLHAYFSQQQFLSELIKKHFFSYWRWYVTTTWKWKLIETLPREEFLMIFPKQCFAALILEERVEDELLYCLFLLAKDESDVQDMYASVRQVILSDALPVCMSEETTLSLVEKINGLDREDNLTRAEVQLSIEQSIFSGTEDILPYEAADRAQIVASTINFFRFVQDVPSIIDIYEAYLASFLEDHYDDIPGQEEVQNDSEKTEEKIPEPKEATEKKAPMNIKTKKEILPPKEEPAPPAQPEKKAPSYRAIRKQIESEFSFLPDGQPENVEGVLGRLDALAQEYGDEKITELFYFNEASGRFEWDEQLLMPV
jgi:hypothetical protein